MLTSAESAARWRKNNPELVKAYQTSPRGRYSQLKREASRRRQEVLGISFEQYVALLGKFPKCYYCGGELPKYGYGLDRLDNQKGYTLDNVVTCCGSKDGKRERGCNSRKGLLESAGFRFPRTVQLMFELCGRAYVG